MSINRWIIFWFVAGMAMLVVGIIAAVNHKDAESIAWMAYSFACCCRCECKILQQRIEKLEK